MEQTDTIPPALSGAGATGSDPAAARAPDGDAAPPGAAPAASRADAREAGKTLQHSLEGAAAAQERCNPPSVAGGDLLGGQRLANAASRDWTAPDLPQNDTT